MEKQDRGKKPHNFCLVDLNFKKLAKTYKEAISLKFS